MSAQIVKNYQCVCLFAFLVVLGNPIYSGHWKWTMICLDSTFLKLWNRACTLPSAAGWGNLLTKLYLSDYEGGPIRSNRSSHGSMAFNFGTIGKHTFSQRIPRDHCKLP